MGRPESDFPTIRDLRDGLARLVDAGLGDLPVQVIIAPDSTMQAIARATVPGHSVPAILMEFDAVGGRLPMTMVTTDRWSGREMKSRTSQ